MLHHYLRILFSLLVISMILEKTFSLENDEQFYIDPLSDESLTVDSNHRFDQQYPMIDKDTDLFQRLPFENHRRSESAEKYFKWAGKTQRPVEFLRGKRFWLFAKKDDGGISAEAVVPINTQAGSLTQGLWRSGIVGRRRRR